MELPIPVRAVSLLPAFGRAQTADAWQLAELTGRIVELSSHGASATATLAMRLVVEAQRLGDPAAWVTARGRCFYPPDALANGVDFAAFAVVRVPDSQGIGKAADYLIRSGAFGVVVLDLGSEAKLPERQLTRLLGLAQRHGTAVVCLTAKPDALPSLGSLVSLRGPVGRKRLRPGEFVCELRALKDKRRSPGWRHTEACQGPEGYR